MKSVILIAASLFILTACGGSKKGAWSADDKEKANAAVKEIEGELDVLGDKKQAYIDCYLEKMEDNYASFADADSDMAGAKKLAEECASEVLGM